MMGGKKNIRMIVTDLDGTLVNAAYEITEENKKAVQAAAEIGVPTVIATGRMHSSAVQYAEALGVDAPIISYNGAIVKTAGGELLASSYLEPQVVERVLGFVFAQGWYVQSYVGDKLYYVEKTEAARVYETASKVYGEAIGRGGMLARTKEVPKLLVAVSEAEIASSAGLSPWIIRKNYLPITRSLDAKRLARSLQQCLQADQDYKSGLMDAGVAVEMTIIRLCS